MNRSLIPALLLIPAVAALGSALPAASRGEAQPISLVRSAPAMDTVLTTTPLEIRLWFSAIPRPGSTSIRLLDSSAQAPPVHVTDPLTDPADRTVQFADVHGDLPAGRYTVAWATVAEDGVSASGEIAFSVASP